MDVDGLLVYLREIAAGLLTLSVPSFWKWHLETTYVFSKRAERENGSVRVSAVVAIQYCFVCCSPPWGKKRYISFE